MPELPEVELVTRFLRGLVCGRRIVSAELTSHALGPAFDTRNVCEAIAGTQINVVERRGKHILFGFDNDRTLVTHLRMSGRFMLLIPRMTIHGLRMRSFISWMARGSYFRTKGILVS